MKDYLCGAILGLILAYLLMLALVGNAHALPMSDCQGEDEAGHTTSWMCNNEDTTP